MKVRRGALGIAAACGVAVLVGCSQKPESIGEVRIAVHPDIAGVAGWSDEIENATGVAVEFTTSRDSYDGMWTESVGATSTEMVLLGDQPSVYRTPLWRVALVVKASTGRRLGWCTQGSGQSGAPEVASVSWQEIAARAGQGQLRFAMPNPNYSAVGAAVVYALHVGGHGKEPEMTEVNSPLAKEFGKGHMASGPSAAWGVRSFLAKQSSLDGVFVPEPGIEGLYKSKDLREPLCVVWPKEAIPVATYTLVLTNGANQEAFDRVGAFIASHLVQKASRPWEGVSDGVALATPDWQRSRLLQLMVRSYLELHMRPGVVMMLVDTSSGMAEDGRLEAVKSAIAALARGEEVGDRYSRLRNNEKLVLLSYPSSMAAPREFFIDRTRVEPAAEIQEYLESMTSTPLPGDVSASIGEAYQMALDQYARTDKRRVAMVVISALDADTGQSRPQLQEWVSENTAGMSDVEILILALDARSESPGMAELAAVARASGGEIWSVRSDNLEAAIMRTRAYQ